MGCRCSMRFILFFLLCPRVQNNEPGHRFVRRSSVALSCIAAHRVALSCIGTVREGGVRRVAKVAMGTGTLARGHY